MHAMASDCPRRPIDQGAVIIRNASRMRYAHPAVYSRMGVVQGMKGTGLQFHAMELQARIVPTS